MVPFFLLFICEGTNRGGVSSVWGRFPFPSDESTVFYFEFDFGVSSKHGSVSGLVFTFPALGKSSSSMTETYSFFVRCGATGSWSDTGSGLCEMSMSVLFHIDE